jgi:hypothetical protein
MISSSSSIRVVERIRAARTKKGQQTIKTMLTPPRVSSPGKEKRLECRPNGLPNPSVLRA